MYDTDYRNSQNVYVIDHRKDQLNYGTDYRNDYNDPYEYYQVSISELEKEVNNIAIFLFVIILFIDPQILKWH